jgi:hypothetical protein
LNVDTGGCRNCNIGNGKMQIQISIFTSLLFLKCTYATLSFFNNAPLGNIEPVLARRYDASELDAPNGITYRGLFKRDTCSSGLAACNSMYLFILIDMFLTILDTGLCCPTNGQCCDTGCGPSQATCCSDGKYCPAGFGCCGNGSCVPDGGQCCGDGTSCDAGNICVKIANRSNDVCCTDTECTAYVSNGATMTYATIPTTATNAMTAQKTLSSAQVTAFVTSSGGAPGGSPLTTYTFTITW